MSREIKFRAWDKKRKEWYGASDPSSLTFYGFHIFGECVTSCQPPLEELQNIILSQFTGLYDENGKEIYEGDLIHWVIYDDGYDGKNFKVNKNKIIKEGIGKVYWASDHFKIKGCKKSISSLVFSASKEVVGNIYEGE